MGKSYRDLFIWSESVEIAADIVAMTEELPRPKHTQLEIARRINLLKPGSYEHLTERMRKVGSGINNLMRRLNSSIAKQLRS